MRQPTNDARYEPLIPTPKRNIHSKAIVILVI